MVTLQRKDPNKGDIIDNVRSIALQNADYKILAKRLALVASRLVDDAQNCTIPNRCIHNFHLKECIINRVGKESYMTEALINLDQTKAFFSVCHHYLQAVFKVASFELVFRNWIAEVYNDICSMFKVKWPPMRII